MKIPNINANSIKNFFLYNVEKVILGISLVLLGVLFYLGMSSTKYDKTPDGLVSETKNAASFINRTSNWELISDYRKGDTQVPDRISQASAPVDSSGFKIAGLSMIPKALQLRADPPLPTVIDLEAGVIRATIAVRLDDRNDFSDPLLELPQAIRQVDPDAEEKKGARAMSMEDEMMKTKTRSLRLNPTVGTACLEFKRRWEAYARRTLVSRQEIPWRSNATSSLSMRLSSIASCGSNRNKFFLMPWPGIRNATFPNMNFYRLKSAPLAPMASLQLGRMFQNGSTMTNPSGILEALSQDRKWLHLKTSILI